MVDKKEVKKEVKKEESKQEKAPKVDKIVGQSEDNPPQIKEGEKAVWHKAYSYTNKAGNEVKIRGHWEIIKIKPKVEKKVEEKAANGKANGKTEEKK